MPTGQTPHLGKLLVVDDEQAIVDVLVEFFSDHGLEVFSARDGDGALAVADRAHPDVIILDIMMPGMNGVEVLQQLHLRWPDLPVIMLSAIGDEERAKGTLKRGAFDFVAKPFDFDHLRQCVDAALASRGPDVTPSAPSNR